MFRDIPSCHNWERCWERTMASGGQGWCLYTECTKQPLTTKNYPVQNVHIVQKPSLPRLRHPDLSFMENCKAIYPIQVEVFFSALEYLKEKYKSFSPIQWFAFIPSITRTACRSILFIWNLLLLFGFTHSIRTTYREINNLLSVFNSALTCPQNPVLWTEELRHTTP